MAAFGAGHVRLGGDVPKIIFSVFGVGDFAEPLLELALGVGVRGGKAANSGLRFDERCRGAEENCGGHDCQRKIARECDGGESCGT